MVRLMKDIGVQHCGVADTIGVGTPRAVQAAMERALKHYPLAEVSGHFHDTYGQALANILACLELGVHTFDTSVAGLGGCPYAKGATGNVATEDVVFMLHGMGIDTGIDLDALVDAGAFICGVLGRAAGVARRQGAAGQARRRRDGVGVSRARPKASSAWRARWPSAATRMRRAGWTWPRAPRRRRPTRWAWRSARSPRA